MQMKVIKSLAAICALTMGLGMKIGTASAGGVIGWIEVRPEGGLIQITGRATGPEAMKISYTLAIERMGRSGKTATRQSGKADVEAGKIAKLSTTSVNVGAQEELAIILTIEHDGRVVSTSAINAGHQ